MKTKKIYVLLTSILLAALACSNANENPNGGEVASDCLPLSFKEHYVKTWSNDSIFHIKGVALEVVEYGRSIKVVEDLKGNFEEQPLIFVWGDGVPSKGVGIESDRVDKITQYHQNDTLIVLIGKAYKRYAEDIEKAGDYVIMPCARSTLKFSNGYAIGYINSWWGTEDEVETMLWEELQKELHALINSSKQAQP
jgi:hypothetical protein